MGHELSDSQKCPISFALEVFGDRWTLLIIRDLIFKGKKYYGDFLNSPEKISTNILADRLEKLVSTGVISKSQDVGHLSKYVYALTPKGKDLLPLLLEMTVWSSKYNPQPDTPSSVIEGAPLHLLERISENRAALIEEILGKLP